jgi:hypothetical protein
VRARESLPGISPPETVYCLDLHLPAAVYTKPKAAARQKGHAVRLPAKSRPKLNRTKQAHGPVDPPCGVQSRATRWTTLDRSSTKQLSTTPLRQIQRILDRCSNLMLNSSQVVRSKVKRTCKSTCNSKYRRREWLLACPEGQSRASPFVRQTVDARLEA